MTETGRKHDRNAPATLGGSYLTAEVSASAVRANLAALRGRLAHGTRLCAVVKANCYGHGLDTLLEVIAEGADSLAVATPEEALDLRRRGCTRQILTFFSACAYAEGRELHEALDELIARQVTLTVVAPAEVTAVTEAAGRLGAEADVHAKIDTGMGRSGVPTGEAPGLVEAIRAAEGVRLTGLYTHFATADEPDDRGRGFAREQLRRFHEAVEAIGGRKGLVLHVANSAAVMDMPESHLDMVRPGIAVYGYQPSEALRDPVALRPCLRLTGKLMQIKTLPAGSGCGYGLTHTFDRATPVGLVPAGYADGYIRRLSNRSSVRIDGRDAPIRGRVAMDQIIIDLTDVPDARVGDDVEIISPDPAAPNSVENLARLAETIPYEVTCGLGRRVRRTLIE